METLLSDPRTALEAGLSELELELDPTRCEQLVQLAELLARWNERINLSGHRTASELMSRLILDAVALSQELPDAPSLVDLGSGAGFPGLPLAIERPTCGVLLVEARERRHHFQRTAIRALGLRNVRARRGRIEALDPEPAAIVVAQAVSPPASVLDAMLPWAEAKGIVVIPGSETAPDPGTHPQILSSEVRSYRVPLGGALRTLWIGTKR